MTGWPCIQIIDAPTPDGAVLFDFNEVYADTSTETLADGFSVGAPSLQGDVDAPGVQWGLREVTLTLLVKGGKTAALSVQARLARVLLRPRVWVMFQLDLGVEPVYWHAYRSAPGAVSFDEVWTDDTLRPDRWTIGVSLQAEDFGYGFREPVAALSLAGGEPSSSAPQVWRAALPRISGDAPTRLRIAVSRTDSVKTLGKRPRLIVLSSATDADPTRLLSLGLPSWTTGADTTVAGSRATTAFDDTDLAVRVSGSVSTVEPGTYMAYLRARGGTSGTSARTLTTQLMVAGQRAGRQVHSYDAGMTAQWLDLGRVGVGVSRPADLPWTPQAGRLEMSLGTDVTGWSLTYDYLLLIPVDGPNVRATTCVVASTSLPAGDSMLIVDGDSESAWLEGSDPAYSHGTAGALSGGAPSADPAAGRNTLVYLPGSVTVAGSVLPESSEPTSAGATYAVAVSWAPRLMWLNGGDDL